jgi:hypothetical protein
MTDREIIGSSYQDTVALVYRRFFDSYLVADDDEQRAHAEQAFQRGIQKAREIRDRALAILPPA